MSSKLHSFLNIANRLIEASYVGRVEKYPTGNIFLLKTTQGYVEKSSVDVFVVPSYGANALQITNYTGHPTVVVPNGFTDKHTPTSISFIAGYSSRR